MKKYINLPILTVLMLLLAVTACDKDFEAINTNPNSPESVSPSYGDPQLRQ